MRFHFKSISQSQNITLARQPVILAQGDEVSLAILGKEILYCLNSQLNIPVQQNTKNAALIFTKVTARTRKGQLSIFSIF